MHWFFFVEAEATGRGCGELLSPVWFVIRDGDKKKSFPRACHALLYRPLYAPWANTKDVAEANAV